MSDKLFGFVGSVVTVNGVVILFCRVDDGNGQRGLGGDKEVVVAKEEGDSRRRGPAAPCFC